MPYDPCFVAQFRNGTRTRLGKGPKPKWTKPFL